MGPQLTFCSHVLHPEQWLVRFPLWQKFGTLELGQALQKRSQVIFGVRHPQPFISIIPHLSLYHNQM